MFAYIIGGLLIFSILVYLIRYWWNEEAKKIETQQKLDRGKIKEIDAKRILKKNGYKILSEQTEYKYNVIVNNNPIETNLRIDYLVRYAGKKYVVEVKTGEKAVNIQYSPTRRQILEYSLVVPCDGILLLNMENEKIYEIKFPFTSTKNSTNMIGYISISLIIGFISGLSFYFFYNS
jgi:hypothetical protein